MRANDLIEIEFINWKKYQPDSRYKKSTWLRVQNNLWSHPLWSSLSDAETRVFWFLLQYASFRSHSEGKLCTTVSDLSYFGKIRAKDAWTCLKKLIKFGVVSVSIHRERTVRAQCNPTLRNVPNVTPPGESLISSENGNGEKQKDYPACKIIIGELNKKLGLDS